MRLPEVPDCRGTQLLLLNVSLRGGSLRSGHESCLLGSDGGQTDVVFLRVDDRTEKGESDEQGH